MMLHHPKAPRPPSIQPPWDSEDSRPGTAMLLVAYTQERRCPIRERLQRMPTKQGQHSTRESGAFTYLPHFECETL